MLAAVISWLDARRNNGQWLLRFEDVDSERCHPQYVDIIRRQLETLGLSWDAELDPQSARLERYEEILASWLGAGDAYACRCTRKDLQPFRRDGETRYPGTCRGKNIDPDSCAVRFRLPTDSRIIFHDSAQGRIEQNVAEQCGDFIIRRRTGDFSYQFAVSVDDADQGITHVVRGVDLLASTGRQILLLQKLGAAIPSYKHHRILRDSQGLKISKSTGADAVDLSHPSHTLRSSLSLVGIDVPGELANAHPSLILDYALEHA